VKDNKTTRKRRATKKKRDERKREMKETKRASLFSSCSLLKGTTIAASRANGEQIVWS